MFEMGVYGRTRTDMDKHLLCPHGNVLASDYTMNGVRRVSVGLPKCCLEMLRSPAAGESFIIVDRKGKQKLVHDGLMGAYLVEAERESIKKPSTFNDFEPLTSSAEAL